SPSTAAHAAPAGGGRRGNGCRSSPSSARRRGGWRPRSAIWHALPATCLIPGTALLLSSCDPAATPGTGACAGPQQGTWHRSADGAGVASSSSKPPEGKVHGAIDERLDGDSLQVRCDGSRIDSGQPT